MLVEGIIHCELFALLTSSSFPPHACRRREPPPTSGFSQASFCNDTRITPNFQQHRDKKASSTQGDRGESNWILVGERPPCQSQSLALGAVTAQGCCPGAAPEPPGAAACLQQCNSRKERGAYAGTHGHEGMGERGTGTRKQVVMDRNNHRAEFTARPLCGVANWPHCKFIPCSTPTARMGLQGTPCKSHCPRSPVTHQSGSTETGCALCVLFSPKLPGKDLHKPWASVWNPSPTLLANIRAELMF